jgi:hypothetical protein
MKLVHDLHKESVFGYYLVQEKDAWNISFTITPNTYEELHKDTNGNKFAYLNEVVSDGWLVYKFDSRKDYLNYIHKVNLAEKLMR